MDNGLKHIREILPRLFVGNQLIESTILPEPPYDSPIELAFAKHCYKHLSPNVDAKEQFEVGTKHGLFRVDFGLFCGKRAIAVECDGKDYHEGLRDEIRDAILLGEGHFDTAYHFRGCDLVYYPYDCVWLMSVLDRDLFTDRAHLQLGKLRSLTFEIKSEKAERDESFLFNIDPPSLFFWAFRRSINLTHSNPRLRYHWKSLYEFACKYPGANLDDLVDIRCGDRHHYNDKLEENE
ncbi:MAG: hypothetical protein M0R49_01215 [Limnochordia bacterium]|nr:hypothetical protein [Limnochordia bacterium]